MVVLMVEMVGVRLGDRYRVGVRIVVRKMFLVERSSRGVIRHGHGQDCGGQQDQESWHPFCQQRPFFDALNSRTMDLLLPFIRTFLYQFTLPTLVLGKEVKELIKKFKR